MIDSQTLIHNNNNNQQLQKQHKIYTKIKLLGSGAYAKAYLVQQISTSNYYVIKQINISDMTSLQQQNVIQQAKILQILNHPNIIKFKDIHISKMKLNIVMEYADNGDLAYKIKQAKQKNIYFQQNLILNWFTQICLGIKHIHDRKIIHRDLKGQNIFLTSDNCVKIGDLGVAKILQHTVAKARTIIGTPYYMSPQVIQNRPYSFKTDIWSLGTLLYEMCSLTPPFTANNLQFLALKIVRGNYPSIPSQYSTDLKSLIKSMLNTNPNLRPNINQILSSPLINKRIKSLLTQSQTDKQFSHTILHKFNAIKNQIEDKLRPPPNLIQIQQQNQNLSAIIQAKKICENQLIAEVKAKTPLCIGKNAPPIKKKISVNDRKVRPNTAQHLSDIMKIKATPLQQHIIPQKLPKVSPNPIKKLPQHLRPPQIQSEKLFNNIKDKVQIQNKSNAFNKKKSIDCTQYKKVQPQKQIKNNKLSNHKGQEKQQEISQNNSSQIKSNKSKKEQTQDCLSARLAENVSNNFLQNQGPSKIKLQLKAQFSAKNQKKVQQKIIKPVSAKQKQNKIQKPKQRKQQKQTKLQLVSQQLQKKQKNQKELQKKTTIKKQQIKKLKSRKNIPQITNNQIGKNQSNCISEQQIIEEEKCNDISNDNDNYEQQQFQVYQQNQQQSLAQQCDQNSDISFSLSDSSLPQVQHKKKSNESPNKTNYLKMLAQLQIITKMVDQANGKVQNLPIIGASLTQLLQLSNSQTNFNQKQCDLNSNLSQDLISNSELKTSNMSNKLNVLGQLNPLNNTKSLINFACLSDQSQLQNLRIALQEIFGIDNIIKIYKLMQKIVEEYGLEFNQQDVIRKILKQFGGIQQTCLRRHFRFIVTVIVIENQIVKGNTNL